jgi:ubiquinone/menaquinone biosynthesis C-methylase UbiE
MTPALKSKWPKVLPPLTEKQKYISNEFMRIWHEVLPKHYGIAERFNQVFPVKHSNKDFLTTLEIGAGLGEHIGYEKLSSEQANSYYALEMRENMAEQIRTRFPQVQTVVGDCQERLDFQDGHFDRILAIHVLEHLPNLPKCIEEAYRLINKTKGQFIIVIPTEGSPAYSLGRKISAERVYKKHFGGDYSWFYKREHINLPLEIIHELEKYFIIEKKRTFPFPFLPFIFCNLCIGIVLKPKSSPTL